MAEIGSAAWWNRFKTRVNKDKEMKVRGHDRFNENFYVHIGDESFLIKMNNGEVREVELSPDLNDHGSFGIRGERRAWEEFLQEVPPPHNNEVIASDSRTAVQDDDGHLELIGDNKKLFQNLRAFQRTMEILREAHNQGD